MVGLKGVALMDRGRRQEVLLRMEHLTELPLLVLAFAMVPLLVGPILWRLSPTEDSVFMALDSLIWALYAVDLAAKVAVAPDRKAYLRGHWLDVLVVALPFARPLRIVRVFVFGTRAFLGARRLAQVDFLLVWGIGLVLLAATAVTSLEVGHGSIESFPDALWWAVATVTTVGYGDVVPSTVAGRAVGVALMVGGIGLFGALTATFASLLVRADDPNRAAIANLIQEVAALRQEVARLREPPGQ